MESKNSKRRWRWFTISSLFLAMLSVVAVSRPLGDSTLDEISICLPFVTLYYILMGFYVLEKYDEKQIPPERKKWWSFRSYVTNHSQTLGIFVIYNTWYKQISYSREGYWGFENRRCLWCTYNSSWFTTN